MKNVVLAVFLISLILTVIDLIKPFLGKKWFVIFTIILALSIPCVVVFYF